MYTVKGTQEDRQAGSNYWRIEQMETVTLPVKGLNFAGCAREIEKRLGKLESIAHVAASYVSQSVTITYDETLYWLLSTSVREIGPLGIHRPPLSGGQVGFSQ